MKTPEQSAPAKNFNEETITLDTPIIRGETSITSVTLRKPASGELRGVSLVDLASMDVLSLRKVLPRITTPTLTDIEIGRMDPADLLQCGVAVGSFAEEVGQGSCPHCVDDVMADLAIVFHWGPADMDLLPLSELMDWRERAITRWEQTHGK